MKELFFALEVVATFVEGMICLLCGVNLFNKSNKIDIKLIIANALFTVIITLRNAIGNGSVITAVLSVIILSIIIKLYCRVDYVSCLTVCITYYTVITITEMIGICSISVITNDANYVFKILQNSNIVRIIYVILMKVINILIYFTLL